MKLYTELLKLCRVPQVLTGAAFWLTVAFQLFTLDGFDNDRLDRTPRRINRRDLRDDQRDGDADDQRHGKDFLPISLSQSAGINSIASPSSSQILATISRPSPLHRMILAPFEVT